MFDIFGALMIENIPEDILPLFSNINQELKKHDFTITLITYCDDLVSTEVILSKSTTGDEKPYRFFKSGDDINFDYEVGNAGEQRVTVADVLLSSWQMITGTYIESTKNLALYLDGVFQDDITGSYSVADNLDERLTIGANWDEGVLEYSSFFDGKIDETRISNTNRSAAWLKATYNTLWDSLLTYGDEETAEVPNVIFIFQNY